jgi:hypothetical protein
LPEIGGQAAFAVFAVGISIKSFDDGTHRFAQADFFGLLSGTNGARLYRGRTHIRQARIKSVK